MFRLGSIDLLGHFTNSRLNSGVQSKPINLFRKTPVKHSSFSTVFCEIIIKKHNAYIYTYNNFLWLWHLGKSSFPCDCTVASVVTEICRTDYIIHDFFWLKPDLKVRTTLVNAPDAKGSHAHVHCVVLIVRMSLAPNSCVTRELH